MVGAKLPVKSRKRRRLGSGSKHGHCEQSADQTEMVAAEEPNISLVRIAKNAVLLGLLLTLIEHVTES